MPGEYMTLKEAAKFLNINTEAVKLLVKKGIARKDKDGKMYIKTTEIRDWLNRGIRDFEPSLLNKLEKDYSKRYTLIHPLLDPKCVKIRLIGMSKTAIINELVDLLIEKGGVANKHKAIIIKAVIERERMCSTALTSGIAIPHPREPLKGIIKKPRLVIGLSWHGVDFESFDGKPTHIVVLLCTPKLDQHLQFMSRLTGLLRNPKMRVALCRAKDAKQVVETFASFEKESC